MLNRKKKRQQRMRKIREEKRQYAEVMLKLEGISLECPFLCSAPGWNATRRHNEPSLRVIICPSGKKIVPCKNHFDFYMKPGWIYKEDKEWRRLISKDLGE
jgi:hypothetical protein